MLKLMQAAVTLAVAFVTSIITLNNILDWNTGRTFTKEVMKMSTISPESKSTLGSRAVPDNEAAYSLSFGLIILVEFITSILCFIGGIGLAFGKLRAVAQAGLGLGFLLFFAVFRGVAGQWFLMWQSKSTVVENDEGEEEEIGPFNGIPDAHRIAVKMLLALMFVSMEKEK